MTKHNPEYGFDVGDIPDVTSAYPPDPLEIKPPLNAHCGSSHFHKEHNWYSGAPNNHYWVCDGSKA